VGGTDRELKALLCRGYSLETAREILAGRVASPVRLGGGTGWQFLSEEFLRRSAEK
jgi:hypothetical protein